MKSLLLPMLLTSISSASFAHTDLSAIHCRSSRSDVWNLAVDYDGSHYRVVSANSANPFDVSYESTMGGPSPDHLNGFTIVGEVRSPFTDDQRLGYGTLTLLEPAADGTWNGTFSFGQVVRAPVEDVRLHGVEPVACVVTYVQR
jgi:hypothetical protein